MSLNFEIIKYQWDPVANENPFPEDPIKNKEIIGKWRCEKGHFWHETIENRAYYQKCHVCHSPRRATEVYNLYSLHPDIAAQLHPTKNTGITADELTPFSSKVMTWLCDKGHEWETSISTRTIKKKGSGCPECLNLKVGKDNNLAILYPDIAVQLHPTKNKKVIANKLTPRSGKTMFWFCNKGHEWKAKVWERTDGQGCPECSNRRIGKDNSLAVLYPDIAAQWDQEENGNLTPEQVVPASSKKVGWKCIKGHTWKTRVVNRTVKKQACPECSNRKVGKDNNLSVLYPEIASQWDQEENGDLTPEQVVPGSPKKVGWKCIKGHTWKAQITSRIKGRNCPKCCLRGGDYSKIVDQTESAAVLRPDLILEWDKEKNGNISLYELSPESSKRVYWKCSKGHRWKAVITSRVNKGNRCVHCYRGRSKS